MNIQNLSGALVSVRSLFSPAAGAATTLDDGRLAAAEAARLRKREDRRNNLRSIYAAFMLGRRPDQVQYVFMMGDSQDNIAEGARARREIDDPFASAELEGMWQRRFCAPRYDLDGLLRLPARTLGGAYARHMRACNLKPDFFEDLPPRHRMHFLRLRLRQTHDIWHVLAGFGTDEFGEVGLQGFYFAQFTNGQSALILASAVLKSVLRGRFGDLELHLDAFCEGYRNGKGAASLLAIEWEKMWDQDLDAVRAQLRVEAPRCRAGRLVAAAA